MNRTERMFHLCVDGGYLGIHTESYCRAYCREFAHSHHIVAIDVNDTRLWSDVSSRMFRV